MNYTYATELANFELGQRYLDLGPDLVNYIDNVILYGSSKISTIKFLRVKLCIGLVLAKQLYEAREEFLRHPVHPYGWKH